jgi:hypothetical protein
MLTMANFDTVYSEPPLATPQCGPRGPPCTAPNCFIGSYAPVTPAGQMGPFWVNSYFLRPDRKSELAGPVPVRSATICPGYKQ